MLPTDTERNLCAIHGVGRRGVRDRLAVGVEGRHDQPAADVVSALEDRAVSIFHVATRGFEILVTARLVRALEVTLRDGQNLAAAFTARSVAAVRQTQPPPVALLTMMLPLPLPPVSVSMSGPKWLELGAFVPRAQLVDASWINPRGTARR